MMIDCMIKPLVDQFGRLVKEFEGVTGPIPVEIDCATQNTFEDTECSEREMRGLISTFLNQCERAISRLFGKLLNSTPHLPKSLAGRNISTVHV